MNNHLEIHNSETKAAFLAGDSMLIRDLGQTYLTSMGFAPIPKGKIQSFIEGSPEYLQPVGEGWGMSTDDAIRCLFDTERTSQFIKGITKSVALLKQKFGSEKLTAVEAGCGTGVLAIAMALAGVDKVKAIDINKKTVESTKQFIALLGMTEAIEVIFADATTYIPDSLHLLVTENLHTGMYFEPQQQIINHFRPHLVDGAVIVPQGISMRYALATVEWDKFNKTHGEWKHIVLHMLKKPVQWSGWNYIGFQESESFDGHIHGKVPVGECGANALVTQMNVHITDKKLLLSGTAEFLGQPHVVKIQSIDKFTESVQLFGTFNYVAGGNPPKEVRLIP